MARLIKDHSFFAGGKSEGSVFPKGVHTKKFESGAVAGELKEYRDTAESVKKAQDANAAKIKKHAQSSEKRN